MSGGIGSVGRSADDLYARLDAADNGTGGFMAAFDGDANVRTAAQRLAGQARITGDDVVALVREADDMGGVKGSEKQEIASLLEGSLARFDADARIALTRWLGGDAPANARAALSTAATPSTTNPAAVVILANSGTSGASAVVPVAASVSMTTTSRRPTFGTDAQLRTVADGRGTLAQGARGTGVAEVQRALLDMGYDLGAAGADGAFGPGMKAVVVRFQRANGLPQDGVIGKATLDAIALKARPDPRANLRTGLIAGTVGPRGANSIADVKAVQERLQTLGFYTGKINGKYDAVLGKSLRVFDAATKGETTIAHRGAAFTNAATLTPGEDTEAWLRARNAPTWSRTGAGGVGWRNDDADGYSYATSWLQETISRAGGRFQSYITANPGTPLMHTNDASTRTGGDNHDHETHESGLSLDVNLGEGGITMSSRAYDREATWAQITAFLDDPGVRRILFNDTELIRRANADPRYAGRLEAADGHHHHLHVDINAPARIDP